MLIEGFGIAGYRSFGPELQKISPCAKVNLLVGQNNSGKSNVLLFLKDHYKRMVEAVIGNSSISLDSLDRHISSQNAAFLFAIALPFDGRVFKTIEENLAAGRLRDYANAILRTPAFTLGDSSAWFVFHRGPSDSRLSLSPDFVQEVKKEAPISRSDWAELWRKLTNQSQGDFDNHWVPETLGRFRNEILNAPKVSLIPAIRRIDKGAANEDDHSGIGLIEKLAVLQNPPIHQRELKDRFDSINSFLRSVLGNTSATLEVPYERDMILVHMDDRTLPLSSLGTGIHEVTILAAAATALTNRVMCIEEPELHLHPLLQKKLVRYLQNKTDNQYFLTTHSAHLLDTPDAAIFHIRYQDGATTVERVETPAAKSLVCVDLGYRASDLLQANCVIWVEGPSDRIYLNHWIKTADPKLIEGVHYSIMFYGGRLLSHLSAQDPEVTEFISLRRLNRYISILIDSDRSKSHSPLNATKRRVRDEFDQGPGFAWVTKGREIENYTLPHVLEKAVKTVHEGVKKLVSVDQFARVLQYRRLSGTQIYTADKVKIAHEVVKDAPDFSVLDLKKMVDKTVSFIREANDV